MFAVAAVLCDVGASLKAQIVASRDGKGQTLLVVVGGLLGGIDIFHQLHCPRQVVIYHSIQVVILLFEELVALQQLIEILQVLQAGVCR